jgi:hypothetical protein
VLVVVDEDEVGKPSDSRLVYGTMCTPKAGTVEHC